MKTDHRQPKHKNTVLVQDDQDQNRFELMEYHDRLALIFGHLEQAFTYNINKQRIIIDFVYNMYFYPYYRSRETSDFLNFADWYCL